MPVIMKKEIGHSLSLGKIPSKSANLDVYIDK